MQSGVVGRVEGGGAGGMKRWKGGTDGGVGESG